MKAKTTGLGTMDRRCGATPLPAQESPSHSGGRPRWAEGFNWPTICRLAAIHAGALAAPFTFSWAGLISLLLLGWMTGSLGICLERRRARRLPGRAVGSNHATGGVAVPFHADSRLTSDP